MRVIVPRIAFVLLFAATASAQTVSVLPPNAVFSAGAAVVTPCNGCVAVADFNGDGKQDIAYNIQTPAPNEGVLLGNGDGTFRTVGMPGPSLVSVNAPLLVGDFNGDGKPDIALGTAIYLGIGDGTFAAPVYLTNYSGTGSVQIGDFNRDGKTDILCGTSVLLSNGDGTFRSAGTVGTVAMEGTVLVADFNRDGIPDILLSEVSGLQMAVALGHGDGTFGNSMVFASPLAANSLLAADFTGDGFVDLLGYSQKGFFLDVLPGKRDGTFGAVIQTANTSGLNLPLAVAADLNKDGKPDIVAGDAI